MKFGADLLFLHGHIADTQLAMSLASPPAARPPRDPQQPRTPDHPEFPMKTSPMNLFKSLLYLGGLESIDPRIGIEEESFGPTYGNRIASQHAFGKRRDRADERIAPPRANPLASRECAVGGCA